MRLLLLPRRNLQSYIINTGYFVLHFSVNYWQMQNRLITVGFLQSTNVLSLLGFCYCFVFSHLTGTVDVSNTD